MNILFNYIKFVIYQFLGISLYLPTFIKMKNNHNKCKVNDVFKFLNNHAKKSLNSVHINLNIIGKEKYLKNQFYL